MARIDPETMEVIYEPGEAPSTRPADDAWFNTDGTPNKDLIYSQGGNPVYDKETNELQRGEEWSPSEVYGFRPETFGTGAKDASWLTFAQKNGYPLDWRESTPQMQTEFNDFLRATFPYEGTSGFGSGLMGFFNSMPPPLKAVLLGGLGDATGLTKMLSGGGSASGGALSSAAADAAGLARMAADAGLTGPAAQAFVNAGGMADLASLAALEGAPSWLTEAANNSAGALGNTVDAGALPNTSGPGYTGENMIDGLVNEDLLAGQQITNSGLSPGATSNLQRLVDAGLPANIAQGLPSAVLNQITNLNPSQILKLASTLGAGGGAAGALSGAGGTGGGLDSLLPWLSAGGTIADFLNNPDTTEFANGMLSNATGLLNKQYTPFSATTFKNNPDWQAYIDALSAPAIKNIERSSTQDQIAQKAKAAMSGQDITAYGALPGRPDVQSGLITEAKNNSIASTVAGVTDKAFTNAMTESNRQQMFPLATQQIGANTLAATQPFGKSNYTDLAAGVAGALGGGATPATGALGGSNPVSGLLNSIWSGLTGSGVGGNTTGATTGTNTTGTGGALGQDFWDSWDPPVTAE